MSDRPDPELPSGGVPSGGPTSGGLPSGGPVVPVGRLVIVATSPRSAPGLLSWPAWEALRAGLVLVGDADHPQLAFVRDAGVQVEVLTRAAEGAEPAYPGAVPPADRALAATLLGRVRAGGHVTWLAGATDEGLLRALGSEGVRAGIAVEVIYGSYDLPGARLLDVVAVMDRLRSPDGCPWDAKQTHSSLMPYLLEEAYETYETLENGDLLGLREELGDLLLQVAFHARIAEEHADAWSIDDVAGDLVDKLVRRHPHVFADASTDDLEGSWDALKAAEKGRASVTEGVPLGQPALSLASKLQRRGERLGAPVPTYPGLGGELWELVAICLAAGIDPETELRAVARTYRDRLAELELAARAAGREPAELSETDWHEGFSR